MERLQKIIANSGYCSRRKAEEEILKGNVSVNGEIVRQLGVKVDANDIIVINILINIFFCFLFIMLPICYRKITIDFLTFF